MAAAAADGAVVDAVDADAASSWRQQAASLAASFAARGFDLAHPFSVAAFNRGLQERHEAALAAAAAKGEDPPLPPPSLPTGGREDPPALLVGNTGAVFWESFLRRTCAEHLKNGGSEDDPATSAAAVIAALPPDPLDAFVESAAREALAGEGAPSGPLPAAQPLDVRFSHVVRPRERFVDVLRAAAGSGMAYFSIAAHLCAHPLAGPFFSLRAVVVLDAEAEEDDGAGAAFADDKDVERLMEASARAAEASWGEEEGAAAAAARAREAVRRCWLEAYGRVSLRKQRPRDASPFSAEDEERVAAMYRALFAAIAPAAAAAKADPPADDEKAAATKDDDDDEEGHARYRAAAKEKRPWRKEEAWKGWAEARWALGGDRVAPRWRFSQAQVHYHYTRDRGALRRELEWVLSGAAGRRGDDD